ncbi:MAG: prepilin-type N-terminal cleavage/methylation domain-containing protein [Coriobacteriales bacterium]|jgi:prepilin-type N-terminal cleavage/methylation domain-containing protein|nr:prepilin-type N-terminal cleavage/methylation domain-containing protein [Coriobacteriales bacterium]
MRRIAQHIRQVCTSTSGLSLVEVLVASAIVAIVSVMLVYALYTMGAIGKRATDVTTDDATLSEMIALDSEDLAASTSSSIILDPDSGGSITLPSVTFNTYTTEDGRSFTVFEYEAPDTGD